MSKLEEEIKKEILSAATACKKYENDANFKEAIRCKILQKALLEKLYNNQNKNMEIFKVDYELGNLYYKNSQYAEAKNTFVKLKANLREVPQVQIQEDILNYAKVETQATARIIKLLNIEVNILNIINYTEKELLDLNKKYGSVKTIEITELYDLISICYNSVGLLEKDDSKINKAYELYQKSLQIKNEILDNVDDLAFADSKIVLAKLVIKDDKAPDSVKLLQEAFEIYYKHYGTIYDIKIAKIFLEIGKILAFRADDNAGSMVYFKAAKQIVDKIHESVDHQESINLYSNLLKGFFANNDFINAGEVFREYKQIVEDNKNKDFYKKAKEYLCEAYNRMIFMKISYLIAEGKEDKAHEASQSAFNPNEPLQKDMQNFNLSVHSSTTLNIFMKAGNLGAALNGCKFLVNHEEFLPTLSANQNIVNISNYFVNNIANKQNIKIESLEGKKINIADIIKAYTYISSNIFLLKSIYQYAFDHCKSYNKLPLNKDILQDLGIDTEEDAGYKMLQFLFHNYDFCQVINENKDKVTNYKSLMAVLAEQQDTDLALETYLDIYDETCQKGTDLSDIEKVRIVNFILKNYKALKEMEDYNIDEPLMMYATHLLNSNGDIKISTLDQKVFPQFIQSLYLDGHYFKFEVAEDLKIQTPVMMAYLLKKYQISKIVEVVLNGISTEKLVNYESFMNKVSKENLNKNEQEIIDVVSGKKPETVSHLFNMQQKMLETAECFYVEIIEKLFKNEMYDEIQKAEVKQPVQESEKQDDKIKNKASEVEKSKEISNSSNEPAEGEKTEAAQQTQEHDIEPTGQTTFTEEE